jgi:anaerobic ribonucleoside-triphosphate reductase activating protein
MNLGGIQFPVFSPYGKPTIEIYISGCGRYCNGCHNPELQNFDYGTLLNTDWLIKYLKEREELFDIISFTGGDLLENAERVFDGFLNEWLIKLLQIAFPNKEFWLFTGATQEELPQWTKELFDYIKVGRYDETLKHDGFPASSNQKLLKKGLDF